MQRKTKILLLSIGGIVVVVGALAGIKAMQIGAMMKAGESYAPPPEAVTSAKVEETEWQPMLTSVGTLVAERAVTIGAELSGTVKHVGFESGSEVKKGTVLVRLDTSIEDAQLAAATADSSLAALNAERSRTLRTTNTNTQSDLDTAEARANQSKAMVDNYQAMIAKKTIRAPFDGRVGMREVELGQVVSPGTAIVTLTSFDPIFADFFLPQQALSQIEVGQAVHVTTDSFVGDTWQGKVSAISPQVDVNTRNVKVRAVFPNKDARLRPGMFVSISVLKAEKKKVLAVAATAVIFAPYGDSVFIIEEEKDDAGAKKNVARQKFVRLGERRGDMVAVEDGIAAGDTIVTTGAFKLRNGAAVVENNSLAPDAKLDPKPKDT